MITIKPFIFNSFQVNTYLLYDETNESIIIDPACSSEMEQQVLLDFIQKNNLSPRFIANTHGHIDHVIGVQAIADFFKIPFYIHKEDDFLLQRALESAIMFGFNLGQNPTADKFISESAPLTFGHSTIKLFHVPGHSPGSLVFYSENDGFIIAGDVLFNGSIGRTDLPGGNYETLISGIKEKLLVLPRETIVYSGHGNSTTIGHEHDTNPFLV